MSVPTSIYIEDAPIVSHEHYAHGYHLLRVQAERCAADAKPGQFVHVQCAPALLRRPFFILRAHAEAGAIELLYRSVGPGTRWLAERSRGERLNLLGPIGRPFTLDKAKPRPLLLGFETGIAPLIFLADVLRRDSATWQPLLLMGAEFEFPFTPEPSHILLEDMPDAVIATLPLLEDWGIAARLATRQERPGCYQGEITALVRSWLSALHPSLHAEVALYARGPSPLLAACATLAREFGLPCQLALDAIMPCAVGACAGCAVPVLTAQGWSMQRVCVDGPVFDGNAVFPDAALNAPPP